MSVYAVLVFLAGLIALAGARVAYADLSSLVLGKIAARAAASSDNGPSDDAGVAAMTMAGQPPRAERSGMASQSIPMDPSTPLSQPTLAEESHERAEKTESSLNRVGALHLGDGVDSRFGLKGLKTWYTMGSVSIKTDLGYDGHLRLQADRPWLGGNLRFGFADQQGHGELRLEFKRNF